MSCCISIGGTADPCCPIYTRPSCFSSCAPCCPLPFYTIPCRYIMKFAPPCPPLPNPAIGLCSQGPYVPCNPKIYPVGASRLVTCPLNITAATACPSM